MAVSCLSPGFESDPPFADPTSCKPLGDRNPVFTCIRVCSVNARRDNKKQNKNDKEERRTEEEREEEKRKQEKRREETVKAEERRESKKTERRIE